MERGSSKPPSSKQLALERQKSAGLGGSMSGQAPSLSVCALAVHDESSVRACVRAHKEMHVCICIMRSLLHAIHSPC